MFVMPFTQVPELTLVPLLLVPRPTDISQFPTNAWHVCAGVLTAPLPDVCKAASFSCFFLFLGGDCWLDLGIL